MGGVERGGNNPERPQAPGPRAPRTAPRATSNLFLRNVFSERLSLRLGPSNIPNQSYGKLVCKKSLLPTKYIIALPF